ncbi:MAG: hypothetical protein SGJ20_15185 [Planctomycetota bacterium]|nr:hypothetical protein [Planctomycetota bacterium]
MGLIPPAPMYDFELSILALVVVRADRNGRQTTDDPKSAKAAPATSAVPLMTPVFVLAIVRDPLLIS